MLANSAENKPKNDEKPLSTQLAQSNKQPSHKQYQKKSKTNTTTYQRLMEEAVTALINTTTKTEIMSGPLTETITYVGQISKHCDPTTFWEI
jgi:hypothetical protein